MVENSEKKSLLQINTPFVPLSSVVYVRGTGTPPHVSDELIFYTIHYPIYLILLLLLKFGIIYRYIRIV